VYYAKGKGMEEYKRNGCGMNNGMGFKNKKSNNVEIYSSNSKSAVSFINQFCSYCAKRFQTQATTCDHCGEYR
jgi:hypothetical protein